MREKEILWRTHEIFEIQILLYWSLLKKSVGKEERSHSYTKRVKKGRKEFWDKVWQVCWEEK